MTRYFLTPLSQDSIFNRLENDMKSVVDQFFRNGIGSTEIKAGTFTPSVDVEETPEGYNVRAELPGLSQKDIEVHVEDESLVISGEKKQELEKREDGRYYFESRSGSFKRIIPLEVRVDEDKIGAELKDGVLRVSVPKAAENEQPRKK